eukprot:TRINITY_DN2804_c0_g1_i1.p1 TRINITY_DN2804_c0_g1~~TRINITY_DN2804_c0_g1_i1.p1  ORF type:complete len:326 (+),score=29.49 TRINITY_DN2804_c0_g1_i1:58-1035(+)
MCIRDRWYQLRVHGNIVLQMGDNELARASRLIFLGAEIIFITGEVMIALITSRICRDSDVCSKGKSSLIFYFSVHLIMLIRIFYWTQGATPAKDEAYATISFIASFLKDTAIIFLLSRMLSAVQFMQGDKNFSSKVVIVSQWIILGIDFAGTLFFSIYENISNPLSYYGSNLSAYFLTVIQCLVNIEFLLSATMFYITFREFRKTVDSQSNGTKRLIICLGIYCCLRLVSLIIFMLGLEKKLSASDKTGYAVYMLCKYLIIELVPIVGLMLYMNAQTVVLSSNAATAGGTQRFLISSESIMSEDRFSVDAVKSMGMNEDPKINSQ